MINRPDLEKLIQELKNLQLDQARIQSRQTDIINLLQTAYQGPSEDDRDRQGTEQDGSPQAAASAPQTNFRSKSQSTPQTRRDKYGNPIRVGNKVQILTFAGLRKKDRYGTITGFTAKRVKVETGSPPEVILRADSNLVRVIDI